MKVTFELESSICVSSWGFYSSEGLLSHRFSPRIGMPKGIKLRSLLTLVSNAGWYFRSIPTRNN